MIMTAMTIGNTIMATTMVMDLTTTDIMLNTTISITTIFTTPSPSIQRPAVALMIAETITVLGMIFTATADTTKTAFTTLAARMMEVIMAVEILDVTILEVLTERKKTV